MEGYKQNERAEFINETTPWHQLTNTPVWDTAKCKQCLLCVPYCPDSSIPVSGGKRQDFDLDHCKGCGICEKACPFQAISMKEGK